MQGLKNFWRRYLRANQNRRLAILLVTSGECKQNALSRSKKSAGKTQRLAIFITVRIAAKRQTAVINLLTGRKSARFVISDS